MKRLVYLTFYFKPDLCAGSFRNSSLAVELSNQAKLKNTFIDLYTTSPNRYNTFEEKALEYEEYDNLRIHRIQLPSHKSGMIDQIFSFWRFYFEVKKMNVGKKADVVFASSSRLFTAYLGYIIARKSKAFLYLDIRDIFVDTMNDVLNSKILKVCILPVLKYIEIKTFTYASHINLISEGFKEYFRIFEKARFSYFSNGIDDEFLFNTVRNNQYDQIRDKKLIVYAGNIGQGQGLHKIIPQAAKLLGDNFTFLIVGDGGAKNLLQLEIDKLEVENVVLKNPVNRKELHEIYLSADYLFLHLNDYLAFRKVLPSKIFELATFSKPIIAGVSGYSAKFIRDKISHSFVFEPCDVNSLVNYLAKEKELNVIERIEFIEKYKRSRINEELAANILNYL